MDWVKTNHVKRALREGRPTAGAWISLCSPISAEMMSRAGFDWLLIDMEHGNGDYQTLLAQLQAIYKRGYQFLTLTSETTLLVQGAAEVLGKFTQEVRPA